MSALDQLFARMVQDVAVSLADLFDKNFETKSFNGRRWKDRRMSRRGSLLMETGALRRSLRYTINGNTITFTSNLPYAKIQNEGGDIKVTPKMKKYFWHRYYSLSKKVKRSKKGQVLKSSHANNQEAEFFKAMALKPVGSVIHIPPRRFIGDGQQTRERIQRITNRYMEHLTEVLIKMSKH